MPSTVSDYIDVRERLNSLHLTLPSGIALLPRNFGEAMSPDQFLYESSTTTVRTLWRQNGVVETKLEGEAGATPEIHEQGFSELVLPTIFVAAGLLSQNAVAFGVAINILSDYAIRFLRGLPGDKAVKLSVVVEKKGGREYKRLDYSGSPQGLKDLPAIVREVYEHDSHS